MRDMAEGYQYSLGDYIRSQLLNGGVRPLQGTVARMVFRLVERALLSLARQPRNDPALYPFTTDSSGRLTGHNLTGEARRKFFWLVVNYKAALDLGV